MAAKSTADTRLGDESRDTAKSICTENFADSDDTQAQEEPFAQFTYTFDTASELRLEEIEYDLNEAMADIEDIKKTLRVIQDVFSGGVAMENKMKETLREYKNRFEEVEETWREERKDLIRKSALVDEKEARLSRQITNAVAVTIEELVKRGKLVCLKEVFSRRSGIAAIITIQQIVEKCREEVCRSRR